MDAMSQLAAGGARELAERESRRFSEYLAGLDDAGWQRTVPAVAPWTAHDLAAHVSLVAEMLGSSVRKSIAGSPGPVWDDVAARKQIYDAKGALPNDQLLTDLRQNLAAITQTWAQVTPADFTTPAWHPSGMWTVARVYVQWLWEIGLHGHDLRSAFDPNARLEPDVATIYVDYLTQALARYLDPQSDPGLAGTYRFVLTNPERTLTVRLVDGTGEVVPGDASGPADVTFRSDASTWLLATINRIDAAQALADGRIQVNGDQSLAERYWKQLRRV